MVAQGQATRTDCAGGTQAKVVAQSADPTSPDGEI